MTLLQAEVLNNADFGILSIEDAVVFAGIPLIRAHNLNATDSAILALLLEYSQSAGALPCVLITADKRLLRAANAEGLKTLNPEITSPADVPALIAALG